MCSRAFRPLSWFSKAPVDRSHVFEINRFPSSPVIARFSNADAFPLRRKSSPQPVRKSALARANRRRVLHVRAENRKRSWCVKTIRTQYPMRHHERRNNLGL
jgi:hypothetical protein